MHRYRITWWLENSVTGVWTLCELQHGVRKNLISPIPTGCGTTEPFPNKRRFSKFARSSTSILPPSPWNCIESGRNRYLSTDRKEPCSLSFAHRILSPLAPFPPSLFRFSGNYTGAKWRSKVWSLGIEVTERIGRNLKGDGCAGRGTLLVASWLAWRKKREEAGGKFAILIRERWRFSPVSGWLYAPQLSRWWLASNERRRKKRRKWLASSLISNGNPLLTPG